MTLFVNQQFEPYFFQKKKSAKVQKFKACFSIISFFRSIENIILVLYKICYFSVNIVFFSVFFVLFRTNEQTHVFLILSVFL